MCMLSNLALKAARPWEQAVEISGTSHDDVYVRFLFSERQTHTGKHLNSQFYACTKEYGYTFMFLCVHVKIIQNIYIQIKKNIELFVCIHYHTFMCIYAYICLYKYIINIFIHIYIYILFQKYVYIYISKYYMYIYIYIHIHIYI